MGHPAGQQPAVSSRAPSEPADAAGVLGAWGQEALSLRGTQTIRETKGPKTTLCPSDVCRVHRGPVEDETEDQSGCPREVP